MLQFSCNENNCYASLKITRWVFIYAFEIAFYLDRSKQHSLPPGYYQTPNSADKSFFNWKRYQNCSQFNSFHPRTHVYVCNFKTSWLEKNQFFIKTQKCVNNLAMEIVSAILASNVTKNNTIKNSLTSSCKFSTSGKFTISFIHSRISFYLKVEIFSRSFILRNIEFRWFIFLNSS